jgi:hypothetical protein
VERPLPSNSPHDRIESGPGGLTPLPSNHQVMLRRAEEVAEERAALYAERAAKHDAAEVRYELAG